VGCLMIVKMRSWMPARMFRPINSPRVSMICMSERWPVYSLCALCALLRHTFITP
jgi:hypothetical protein